MNSYIDVEIKPDTSKYNLSMINGPNSNISGELYLNVRALMTFSSSSVRRDVLWNSEVKSTFTLPAL